MTGSDKGSVTIWMLGLSLLLLLFGGLALDYWRGLALQREMAAIADSAAIAAASGIDEVEYRSSGLVILDRHRARGLALASIASQGSEAGGVTVEFSADDLEVTVTVTAAIPIGLLGVFVDEDEPLEVRATATAQPRLIP